MLLSAAGVMVSCAGATAGELTVEGTHLCCGACVKAVNEAFEGVEGVSNVSVDKEARTVKFEAADRKTARKGLAALAKAGFGGAARFDGKDMPFPKGFKEDGKGDEVTIRGVHNCCPGCVKAITAALEGVDGVQSVKCKKKACTVTGSGISHSSLIAALHAEGLHGNIGGGKKKDE